MGQVYTLTSDEAEKIMAAALKTLKTQFSSAVVSIVNHFGIEIAKTVMDNVRPFNISAALNMAKQSAFTGKSTKAIIYEISTGEVTPEAIGIRRSRIFPEAGGMAIYKEGRLLGGIGVSSLQGADDNEDVAENAILKAGLETKPSK